MVFSFQFHDSCVNYVTSRFRVYSRSNVYNDDDHSELTGRQYGLRLTAKSSMSLLTICSLMVTCAELHHLLSCKIQGCFPGRLFCFPPVECLKLFHLVPNKTIVSYDNRWKDRSTSLSPNFLPLPPVPFYTSSPPSTSLS